MALPQTITVKYKLDYTLNNRMRLEARLKQDLRVFVKCLDGKPEEKAISSNSDNGIIVGAAPRNAIFNVRYTWNAPSDLTVEFPSECNTATVSGSIKAVGGQELNSFRS